MSPTIPPRKRRRRGGRGKGRDGKQELSGDVSEVKLEERMHSGARTSKTTLAYLTETPFSSLNGIVSDLSLRGIIEKMGYKTMTKVQAETLPISCAGHDLVGKARTGTGKTLAFMLPCVEKAVSAQDDTALVALVISPTRELAYQTLEEGRLVATFHDGISLACVVGGTPIKKDYGPLKRCQILIATPGRLNDHIENTQGFSERLKNIRLLVFDECDQLLDGGFKQAIDAILAALIMTKPYRQTLLFSATLLSDVTRIAQNAMHPHYTITNCVENDEDPTHADIQQIVYIAQDDLDLCTELVARITIAMKQNDHYKIIVFFQTARMTQLYFELVSLIKKQSPLASLFELTQLLEMHSRKSQSHRDRVAKIFRETDEKIIMFTSDVSARGMDYPSISLVIQFGAPTDPAQYIHRLGRTGRGDGVRGTGLLLLAHFEGYFLNELRHLPIKTAQSSIISESDKSMISEASLLAATQLSRETIAQAYQAWLGFYNSNLRKLGWSKEILVTNANAWIRTVCQSSETPALQAKTIGKMGLKGIKGLIIDRSYSASRNAARGSSFSRVDSQPSHSGNSSSSRGRGRGRGRSG
uniref:ATP-dependent RNA helicase n=1 Tax=Aureoumbra lagunensis TaxID=44058 RepID=A0A7S3NIK4_9STRA|mmetsp:Transcript_2717/g.4329  ORF Transcript_2717/g.4329 Transcript_2717/m.4329 type:complete len:585 (+) Transcript_2717:47-1801(+)|eukprot:CAMPEP_0197321742 /NCGR_PEP_ID=MMETSP0891-20130614/66143_1 /TAXON_ID=44058 ORGANISM="Aureoumbra lagunensis, Strain CCMP1510" /NCGR_SAMPLE_ID=MMETSP0891 /ASSEMBLY_ACC=CAM_ASM_000534 /LENGTH=584 /DNA_ID=CAMNT_0042813781 /DNA_START=23 /DNA_END=1777 /DNA_ORIENTATION=+